MTKDEIIEIIDMARQAGFVDYELDDGTTNAFDKRYEAFAKLVAEKEREACANICEEMAVKDNLTNYYKVAANAIRARGQE
jgi:hypothetical protein